jgi:hypothetical protein
VIKQLARATAVVLGMIACDSDAVDNKLGVTLVPYSTPVKVDTFCDNGGCVGKKELTGDVSFNTNSYVAEGTTVEFQQYRVDYVLTDIAKEVPFFAAPIEFSVSPKQTGNFTILAAGRAQRTFVYKAVGTKRIEGKATLTMAGYDNHEKQVFIDKQFDISFGDFYVNDSNTDADGGTNP